MLQYFFTKVSWVLLSPFVKINAEGNIYLTEYRGREWYIPYPKRWMALWAKDFMKTHVRYEEVLNEGDVVVEVGACTGEYTVAVAEIVGEKGHVYTFEVDPIAYECLDKNIDLANLRHIITAVHGGISDKKQTIEMDYIPNTIAGSTFHGSKKEAIKYKVDTNTLDGYFDENTDRDEVTLLKLTVNGHEPEIINGSPEMIKCFKYVTFQSARYEETIALLRNYRYEIIKDIALYAGMHSVLMKNTKLV